jgi:hypothetical protein
MGRGPTLVRNINKLRAEDARFGKQIGGVQVELQKAEADLIALRRTSTDAASIKAQEAVLQKLAKQKDGLQARLDAVRERLVQLGDRIVEPAVDAAYPNTRADTPLLLLPVRLETRYFNNSQELRVRIYPDQAHIDAHEPELTSDEIAAGSYYWHQRWPAATAEAEATLGRAAFATLAAQFRPRRAAWIAFTTTPTNFSAPPRAAPPVFPALVQRPHPWSRAAFASLLPNRWTLVATATDGREMFRKTTSAVPDRLNTGPDPADTTPVPTDAQGNATSLPIDPGMAWLVDFADAQARGMAVTITAADMAGGFNLARDTIARLVAFGVNSSMTATDAATRLETLLRAHAYADGLSLLRPGTPTNNGSENAGFDSSESQLIAAMDPMAVRPAAGAGIAKLAAALGIDATAAHLDTCDGRDADPDIAGHMVNLLWSATLGQTLDQLFDPQLTDADIAAARDMAVKWLRPGGQLPTLRIGRQPYGVLPVMTPLGHEPTDAIDGHLAKTLNALRGVWSMAADKAPRLDAPGLTLAQNMEQLLQQTPMAASNRFRRAWGPGVYKNSNADQGLSASQALARAWLLTSIGIKSNTKIAALTLEADNHRLGAAFTQSRIADETAPLVPDYLAAIANEVSRDGGREALARRGNADTLLEALAATAALYEFDAAASVIVLRELLTRGVIADMPARAALRVEETIGIETNKLPDVPRGAAPALAISTTHQQAALVLHERSGSKPMASYVVDQIFGGGRDADAVDALRGTIASLRALAGRPASEIDRLFRGVIDAYSHRIDPWFTAQASRRLEHWRGQAGSRGIGIGGFGWVETLKPDTRPDSEGYIHAPSLQHAQAAAVLRSGHLAHRDASKVALNIDLSSRRVRLAMGLLDGAAQGQSMAAMLGYRLERRLRDTDVALARFILPLRRLFALNAPAGQTVLGQSEAIAARDVIDGIKLIDRRRAAAGDSGGGNWLQGLQAVQPPMSAGERTQVDTLAAELEDMFDAVSDLLVAEGVYQLVGGNMERASAALGAMDRQTRAVDPEVVRTPRTGLAFAQRLGVLLTSETVDAAWPVDARAQAEPRVNAWVAQLIGKPDAVAFAARVVIPGAAPVLRDLTPIKPVELGFSPLGLLMISEPGGRARPSDLQEILATMFAEQVDDAERDAGAELHLLPEAPAGAGIGLAAFEALMDRIRAITAKHRAMAAIDIAPPGTADDDGGDGGVLVQRADNVRGALKAGLAGLSVALATAPIDEAALRRALLALARAGAIGAVPGMAEVADPAETAAQRSARLATLIDHGTQVAARVASLIEQDSALELPAGATPLAKIEHATRRIKILLGEAFAVLPPFTLTDAAQKELLLSLNDGDALIGKRSAVVHGWLARMGEVKPRAGELSHCLIAADMLAGSGGDLRVAQFPHAAGNRWIGLPLDKATPAEVDLSLVLHTPMIDLANPPAQFAGLMCDDWTEVIPAASETTAIAFHYDAPGARPPQAMLLAVHPGNKAGAGWAPDAVLATINEAFDQARMRAVRPQDLDAVGALLPLIYLPENYARDVPGVDFSSMMLKAQAMQPVFRQTVRGKA